MDTATSIDVHTDSELHISRGTVGCKKVSLDNTKGKCDMICLMFVCMSVCVYFIEPDKLTKRRFFCPREQINCIHTGKTAVFCCQPLGSCRIWCLASWLESLSKRWLLVIYFSAPLSGKLNRQPSSDMSASQTITYCSFVRASYLCAH